MAKARRKGLGEDDDDASAAPPPSLRSRSTDEEGTSRGAEEAVTGKDRLRLAPALELEKSKHPPRKEEGGEQDTKNVVCSEPAATNAGNQGNQGPFRHSHRKAYRLAMTGRLAMTDSSDADEDIESIDSDLRPGAVLIDSARGNNNDNDDGTVQYSAIFVQNPTDTNGNGETLQDDGDGGGEESNSDDDKLVVAELAPDTVVGTAVRWRGASRKQIVIMISVFVIIIVSLSVAVAMLVGSSSTPSPSESINVAASASSEPPSTSSPSTTFPVGGSQDPSSHPSSTTSEEEEARSSHVPSSVPTLKPSPSSVIALPSSTTTTQKPSLGTIQPTRSETSAPTAAQTTIRSPADLLFMVTEPTAAPITGAPTSQEPLAAPATTAPTPRPPTNTPTTQAATSRPTKQPTDTPTSRSLTKNPTRAPAGVLTVFPTPGPSKKPTVAPTTQSPSSNPTKTPSSHPTAAPSPTPTDFQTRNPTPRPSESPTRTPSLRPTKAPSPAPSQNPTKRPTAAPTSSLLVDLEPYFPDVPNTLCQERALTWLESDSGRLSFPNQALTRFVLAVLYCDTGDNESWNQREFWISEASVCDWEGVACLDENDVSELNLGTYTVCVTYWPL
jgi:hypothetical protein